MHHIYFKPDHREKPPRSCQKPNRWAKGSNRNSKYHQYGARDRQGSVEGDAIRQRTYTFLMLTWQWTVGPRLNNREPEAGGRERKMPCCLLRGPPASVRY